MKKFNYTLAFITFILGAVIFSVGIGVVYFFIFGYLFKK